VRGDGVLDGSLGLGDRRRDGIALEEVVAGEAGDDGTDSEHWGRHPA
jgi:hypothetical protein